MYYNSNKPGPSYHCYLEKPETAYTAIIYGQFKIQFEINAICSGCIHDLIDSILRETRFGIESIGIMKFS